jgi:alkanesulfonate monooxygenase
MYFGGASPAAEVVAARHADVYLAWGEPPADLAPRIARVAALAAEHD